MILKKEEKKKSETAKLHFFSLAFDPINLYFEYVKLNLILFLSFFYLNIHLQLLMKNA